MSNKITTPPKKEFQSFHDFPIVTDLDDFEADIAFLGIPFGDPYSMGEASNDQCTAPTHIRRYCERALRGLDRYDFDIGGTLLNGEDIKEFLQNLISNDINKVSETNTCFTSLLSPQGKFLYEFITVSYTHLTLPTILRV